MDMCYSRPVFFSSSNPACESVIKTMGQRNNQAWVEELSGDYGVDAQREAHQDLASYLYVVAYNYLRLRQADLYHLADFAA